MPPSGSGAPGSSVGPDPSNMSARTCVSGGAAAFPLGQDRGCLAKCHWRPQQDSPAFQRGAPAQEPLEAAGVLPGAEGPGTSDLLPHFCGPVPRGRSGPPEDTAEGVSRQRVLGISEGRAGSWPGEEQDRPPRCLEGSSGRGGRGAGGARPIASFSHGMPLSRSSGPGGQAWGPELSAPRGRSVARARAPPGGKWPQRRLPPAPPGGSGLQTPPPGVRRAPRPAWGQSSRRAGGQAGGQKGPWGPRAGGWRPSRKPRGPSPGSQPPASVLLEKRRTNETVFSFLFRDSRSWNLHPLGFAIFTHPEPSGLHGDASKQQIPGGNDVTFPFPAAQASRRCRHAGPPA